MPGGALLIDTPGMRELQPWADESAVDRTFEDVAELARACRFADCAHANEPGCAVLEAVAAGTLDQERLEHYRRLLREAAFEERKRDKGAAAEHKRQWKQIHQAQKEMYRRREESYSASAPRDWELWHGSLFCSIPDTCPDGDAAQAAR